MEKFHNELQLLKVKECKEEDQQVLMVPKHNTNECSGIIKNPWTCHFNIKFVSKLQPVI